MDETMKAILAFAGTAGGATFVTLLASGIGKWRSGAAHREQLRNTSLAKQRVQAITDRDAAEKERDDADDRRREAEEHVSILKRQLLLNNIEPIKYGSDLREKKTNG